MVNPGRAWNFVDLDDCTRSFMGRDFEADAAAGAVYRSSRFTPVGKADHDGLFRQAIRTGTPDSFAAALDSGGRIARSELRGDKIVQTPRTAAATFAAGEFNRYYIRGVSLRALATDQEFVTVYRARESAEHRPVSDAIAGSSLPAAEVLEAARRDPSEGGFLFGIPAGPNSGMSVHLVEPRIPTIYRCPDRACPARKGDECSLGSQDG